MRKFTSKELETMSDQEAFDFVKSGEMSFEDFQDWSTERWLQGQQSADFQ